MQLGQAPGSLTKVMRAAQAPLAPNVPMVLRIGVVRSGRIVEERVIKQRTTVSIGTSEDATFVCGIHGSKHELFARTKEGYVLRLRVGMSGRVALSSEVVTLDALLARGMSEVALGEDARGKVTIGETTFLFQFVRPPPPQPRPQLPLAVKGGFANQIDWSLTIIAALSFLLHFGIVGAMYSDWADVVVDDQHSVAGLVDMMHSLPTPTTTETPTDPERAAEPETSTSTTTQTASSKPSASTSTSTSTHSSSNRTMSANDAARLAVQAHQMELDILVASGAKSATEGALRRSEIPPVDLSSRAASSEGIARTGSDLHVNGGATTVATSSKNGGLTSLGGDTRSSSNANAGDTRVVAAPKVEPQIGALGGGAAVSGADRVVATLRGRFKACYQKGLNVDPTMSGKVVITAKIGPNGEVSSADVASSSGLSPDVTACIATTVKRAQFDAQPGPTTLSIPVSFHNQGQN
jgi:outer membrane biosynthesis protein TonB